MMAASQSPSTADTASEYLADPPYKHIQARHLFLANYRDVRPNSSGTQQLMEAIISHWSESSIIIVMAIGNSDTRVIDRWRVIAGAHRVFCVHTAMSLRKLPHDYKVPCKVYTWRLPRCKQLVMAGAENQAHALIEKESFVDKICWAEAMVAELVALDRTTRGGVTVAMVLEAAMQENGSYRYGYAPGNFTKYMAIWKHAMQCPTTFMMMRYANIMDPARLCVERDIILSVLPAGTRSSLYTSGVEPVAPAGKQVKFIGECLTLAANYPGIWGPVKGKLSVTVQPIDYPLLVRFQILWYQLRCRPVTNQEIKEFKRKIYEVQEIHGKSYCLAEVWRMCMDEIGRAQYEVGQPTQGTPPTPPSAPDAADQVSAAQALEDLAGASAAVPDEDDSVVPDSQPDPTSTMTVPDSQPDPASTSTVATDAATIVLRTSAPDSTSAAMDGLLEDAGAQHMPALRRPALPSEPLTFYAQDVLNPYFRSMVCAALGFLEDAVAELPQKITDDAGAGLNMLVPDDCLPDDDVALDDDPNAPPASEQEQRHTKSLQIRKANQTAAMEAYKEAKARCCIMPGLYSAMHATLKGKNMKAGAYQLLLMDFPYEASKEPTDADMLQLRQAVDYFSDGIRGATAIVWCNPFSMGRVRNMFAFTQSGCVGRWRVDPQPFVMVRDPKRNQAPRSSMMMKACTEHAVVAYRKIRKTVNTKAGRPLHRWVLNSQPNNTTLHAHFGQPGLPWSANAYLNYRPPVRGERLKNDEGRPWRAFAEKSLLLYTQLVMKYTREGDGVCDLFGGTCTSAMAASLLGRHYIACEPDAELVRDAQLRLGRCHLEQKRREGQVQVTSQFFTDPAFVTLMTRPPSDPILGPDNCPPAEKIFTRDKWSTALGLEVKDSSLQGVGDQPIGRGLFATMDVAKGTAVCDFWGEWVPPSACTELHTPGYMHVKNPMTGGYLLKADPRCPGAYVNDCKDTTMTANVFSEEAGDDDFTIMAENGCHLVQWVASRDIKAGEEILGSYGEAYWSEPELDGRPAVIGMPLHGDTVESSSDDEVVDLADDNLGDLPTSMTPLNLIDADAEGLPGSVDLQSDTKEAKAARKAGRAARRAAKDAKKKKPATTSAKVTAGSTSKAAGRKRKVQPSKKNKPPADSNKRPRKLPKSKAVESSTDTNVDSDAHSEVYYI